MDIEYTNFPFTGPSVYFFESAYVGMEGFWCDTQKEWDKISRMLPIYRLEYWEINQKNRKKLRIIDVIC